MIKVANFSSTGKNVFRRLALNLCPRAGQVQDGQVQVAKSGDRSNEAALNSRGTVSFRTGLRNFIASVPDLKKSSRDQFSSLCSAGLETDYFLTANWSLEKSPFSTRRPDEGLQLCRVTRLGRLFDYWAVVYFGQIHENKNSSTNFWATFVLRYKAYVLIMTKNGFGYILNDYFYKLIRSPWL
jgi:hypothetical protein